MSSVKHFIDESIKKTGVDEFLWKEFERAGYGGVDITKTPLGTNIVVYAMRPGIIIGRGGVTIKNLARVLEENFELPNPQISVAEIEFPELNAQVMASRIASALGRGVHFRRSGFWALGQIMGAGALGAEIVISGKLRSSSGRARNEKFRDGYVAKSGDPAMKYVRKAVAHAQLKQGILGVRVLIMPPGAEFPDQVKIFEEEYQEKEALETPEEPVAPAEEETSETEVKLEEEEASQ